VTTTTTTSTENARRSGNARAGWSAFLGLVSLATMPLAILATRYSSGYTLSQAGYAIPFGVVTGVGALLLARSARLRNERALGRLGGDSAIRLGLILGAAGICLALTALISVVVYLYLRSRA
jgi:hypothetical protein